MESDKAIMAFSQSEKIKTGLIWILQTIELLEGLSDEGKKGGERVVSTLLQMIGHEIRLAGALVAGEPWEEIEPFLHRATVMVDSGVAREAGIHLSRALSKVTNIGQRAMTCLRQKGLL